MSHFSLVVIGGTPDTLESLMAPFDEQTENPLYQQFADYEEEYRQKYENEAVEMVKLASGALCYTWDDQFKVKSHDIFSQETVYPEGSQLVQVPHRERYDSFEAFMADWVGKKERDPQHGRYGYWHNPQAKWDWYVVGGRWMGYFKLKSPATGLLGTPGAFNNTAEDHTADAIVLRDWDLAGQREEAVAKARQRYDAFHTRLAGRELPPSWPSVRKRHEDIEAARAEYHGHPTVRYMAENRALFAEFDGPFDDVGTEFGVSLDEYLKAAAAETGVPFAILKDGQWLERGQMGWFGAVSEELDAREWAARVADLFDSLPLETPLLAVDCHI